MTKSAKKTWLYLTVFLFFALLAISLRTIALFIDMDINLIYFKRGGWLNSSAIAVLIFSLFALSYVFVAEKKLELFPSFDTPRTYIPSGIVAVALLYLGGELISKEFLTNDLRPEKYFSGAYSIIAILTTVLSIICAANFFLNVLQEKRQSTSRSVFCLLCALFLGCYAGYLFFSNELPINAPNKAVDQLSYLFLAIFFLYETRISLGRAMWKLYFAFGLIAACLAFYSSVPSLIYYFYEGKEISNSIAENVLTLTMAIYTTSRISLVATLLPDAVCDTAKYFEEMTKARENDIKSHNEQFGELDIQDSADTNEEKIGSNYEIKLSEESASEAPDEFQSNIFDEIESKE